MTMITAQLVDDITPITFTTDARELATRAYEAVIEQASRLSRDQWAAPTECAPWDVAAMVGHLIGAADAGASLRESLRQQLWAKRHGKEYDGSELDAVNELQVRTYAELTPEQRLAKLREQAPKAVTGRMRLPRVLRRITVPVPTAGSVAEGSPTSLSMSVAYSTIYTRDIWLHRVDIARATQEPLVVDEVLDSRLVADVVREWAGRHGRPFHLVLTGNGGGEFRTAKPGVELIYDAVEFCRILSGRAPADGLTSYRVFF